MDECAGDGHRALERVDGPRAAELPRDRRDQAVLGHLRFVAEREEQEGAGAVGVLHVAALATIATVPSSPLIAAVPRPLLHANANCVVRL